MYVGVMCIDFASVSTIFRFDFGTDSGSVSCLDSGSVSCLDSGSVPCPDSGSVSCLDSGIVSCLDSGSVSCLGLHFIPVDIILFNIDRRT